MILHFNLKQRRSAMSRNTYILLFINILFAFSGCNSEDKFNTSHPDDGGINLTVDWPQIATQTPSNYLARIVYPSGTVKVFENLSGASNNLVVEPGKATIFVYNAAEQIRISGIKAIVNEVNGGIANYPGAFFSYHGQIFTERDKDINQKVVMNQQTGELKFSFAIKPAQMINKVKNIHVVLEGVASTYDMQTGELSSPSIIRTTLSKNPYYATAVNRLFGFDRSRKQNLTLEVELENGNKASITTDLSTWVSEFNHSKNTLFSLSADLTISGEQASSLTIDRWEVNKENCYLSVYPSDINLNHSASEKTIDIITDQSLWVYSIESTGNWLTATKSNDRLILSAAANTSGIQREATVRISAGGLTESVKISQQSNTSPPPPPVSTAYADKETVKLQSATAGNGVILVLMGDGYTVKDMEKGTGKYEKDMRAAVDHFFSTNPFDRFRNYFDIYMIAAISRQEGISVEIPSSSVDNRFETIWEGSHSTGISCNEDIVFDYLNAISDLEYANINDITVVMPINAAIYAGTCFMFYDLDDNVDYANGFSISMCPVGNFYKQVIVHESGGHGFAKLGDEYFTPKEVIPDQEKEKVNKMKKYGWFENIDFSAYITQTSWKNFVNLPQYNMVGAFEGAYTYGIGVWRPEYNSCMNDNVLYFNAPSRWAQIRRVMRLAGRNYSFSQFLSDDIIPEYPTATRNYVEKALPPLSPPVLKTFKNR